MSDEIIYEACSVCGNVSGYDKESLEGSKWIINGQEIVLCCPCEDELLKKLILSRISEKRFREIADLLMSDEKEDLLNLIEVEE